jgi:hypothetical protein
MADLNSGTREYFKELNWLIDDAARDFFYIKEQAKLPHSNATLKTGDWKRSLVKKILFARMGQYTFLVSRASYTSTFFLWHIPCVFVGMTSTIVPGFLALLCWLCLYP